MISPEENAADAQRIAAEWAAMQKVNEEWKARQRPSLADVEALNSEINPLYYDYKGSFEDIPPMEPPPTYCGEWLRGGSFSMVFARAGMGKSALCADLVTKMKDRKPWMGQDTHDPGKVVWINGDMPLWQMTERMGYMGRLKDVELINVDNKNLLHYQEEVLKDCEGAGLVVFDNFNALIQLEDMMTPESWAPYNAFIKRLCATGSAVIVQQHEGKGGSGSFGSSAQEWPVTNILRISTRTMMVKDEGLVPGFLGDECLKLVWTKNRMCDKPEGILFVLEPKPDGSLVADRELFYDDFGKRRIPLNGARDV